MLHSTFQGHTENGTSGVPIRIMLGLQTRDRRAKNGCSNYHTSLTLLTISSMIEVDKHVKINRKCIDCFAEYYLMIPHACATGVIVLASIRTTSTSNSILNT